VRSRILSFGAGRRAPDAAIGRYKQCDARDESEDARRRATQNAAGYSIQLLSAGGEELRRFACRARPLPPPSVRHQKAMTIESSVFVQKKRIKANVERPRR